MAQQQQSAEKWDRQYNRVWAKKDQSLVTQASKIPPDGITEERLHQARELACQLRRVANQALEQAEKAEQVVLDFERILNLRQGAEPDNPSGTVSDKTG